MLNQQQGIGLIEVLVALFLLAIAVLGFAAMQMRAVQATDETLIRSDAMVIIRNISEDLRHYPTSTQKAEYITAINNPSASIDCSTGKACNKSEQIQYNAYKAAQLAKESQIKLKAQNCNAGATEINRVCLIASWDETKPTMDDTDKACADSSGAYKPDTSCIIMETY